MDYDTC
ncbi:hypothetical protein SPV_2555 [Streptococcus pneumoniae]|nr:hypothetical protein SPV_2555 [Streptococcus pneumoniae]